MKYLKCSAVAVFCGMFMSLFYLEPRGDVPLSDIIVELSFSRLPIITVALIDITLRMLPFFVFQILFGTVIYRHFCSASVYYFSRCTDRIGWFLKEALAVWPMALIYAAAMLITGVCVASLNNRLVVNDGALILLGYYLLIDSLWLWFTTLSITLAAVKLGSGTGFTLVAGIQLTFTALLLLWENILPLEDSAHAARNAVLLQLNPVAHLILSWHSSGIDSVNAQLGQLGIQFDLNTSVVLFAVMNGLVLFIGCAVIKRHSLLISNTETGGY